MELRSGWGGSGALIGALIIGAFASAQLKERPVPTDAEEKPEATKPGDPSKTAAGSGGSSGGALVDPLDRSVDEIRTFFGCPRRAQADSAEETAELVEEFGCPMQKKKSRSVGDLAAEIGAMAETRGYKLRFVVALVPDPIGSFVGGQFDAYMAALIRGASASGWLPDRHWFPWWNTDSLASSSKEPRQRSDDRYRRSAGIVLFRSNSLDRLLLTVFLVRESPLTGIHKRTFVDTLRLISSVQPSEEIQVLGPVSSGAATSCALALEDWYGRKGSPRAHSINFLSGSATNPDVVERLKPQCDGCGSLRVTFRRTVASDALLRKAAFKYFEEKLGWHHEEIAILGESDTSYGQQDESGTQHDRTHWRLWLPVSSALSSVRTASEKSRKSEEVEVGGVKVPAYALELKLEETRTPRDVLPVFDSMTAPLNDLELDSLLSTLAKEGIRHLGLVFTDVRDKLFVAQKIREYAPHVSIFTFESSVLYVHPRFNPSTDGMLVVSSYPLSIVTQQLMDGVKEPQRIQFGSDAEQGFYNSTVIALTGPGKRPAVLDYLAIPGTSYLAPGVWISAVGDGRLVPLAAVRPYNRSSPPREFGSGPDPYEYTSLPPDLQNLIDRLRVPAGLRFCFWIVTVAFFLICVSYGLGYSKAEERKSKTWPSVFFRPLERPNDDDRRQQHRWILLLIVAISVIWVALGTVYLVPFLLRRLWDRGIKHDDGLEVTSVLHGDFFSSFEEGLARLVLTILPFLPVLLIGLFAYLGWIIGRHTKEGWGAFGATFLGAAMAVALAVSHASSIPFRQKNPVPLDQAVFTFLRVSSGPGNLSPLAGILLLTAGFVVLLVFQLQRLRIRDGWACSLPAKELTESADLPLQGLGHLQDHLDLKTRQALPRSVRFWLPVLLLLGPLLIAFFFQFEATCDSLLWSKTFASLFAFFLLPASVAAFSRFVSLWQGLRRIIARKELSRLVPAIQRCKEELEWHALRAWGASQKHSYSILVRSVERLRGLSRRNDLPDLAARQGEKPAATAGPTLPQRAAAAEEALARALEANAKREVALEGAARVQVLEALDAASRQVQSMLNVLEAQAEADPRSVPKELRKELREFLAFRVVAYIRYVFSQIRNSLMAFTAGILFLLAGLASFHFQPIRTVYVVLWSVIGLVAVWTVVIFVQMDRNTVLSKISGTEPGEINPIKSGLLLRVATFVLPPVVVLIVTQFPQIGLPLLDLLNPLLRVFQ